MKCGKCGKVGVAVYRNGPKGTDVEWRCIDCVDKQYYPDPSLRKLVADLTSPPKGN